jgi:hypothetical protein
MDSLERVTAATIICHYGRSDNHLFDVQSQLLLTRLSDTEKVARSKAESFDQRTMHSETTYCALSNGRMWKHKATRFHFAALVSL